MKSIIKKIWDKFLLNPESLTAPLTKITKNKKNRIINTHKRTDKSINNQLILFLFVLVNKYSYSEEVYLWSF